MLYETLSQPAIFLWLSLGGFLSGLFFDLNSILCIKLKKIKFFSHFFAFFSTFFTLFVFFYLNLKFNFGQLRLYPIFAFALAFAIERFLSINFVANVILKCYNKLKGKNREKKV